MGVSRFDAPGISYFFETVELVEPVITAPVITTPSVVGVTFLSLPAAVAIGGHRAVTQDNAGNLIYADSGFPLYAGRVLGITTQAVTAGDFCSVQTVGVMTEPSWNWAVDMPIYLAPNGQISQTAPLTGFVLRLGIAIHPQSVFVSVAEPVLL